MRWRRRRRRPPRDPRVDRVVICTPDKDLAQCVRGTRVVQLNRRTRDDPRRSRRDREVRRAAGVDSRLPRARRRRGGRLSRACRAGARSRRRRCSRGSATSKRFRRTGATGASTPRIRRALARTLARERDRAFLFRDAGDAADRHSAVRVGRRAAMARTDAGVRAAGRAARHGPGRGRASQNALS